MQVFVLMTAKNRVKESLPKAAIKKEAYLSVVFAEMLCFVMSAGDFIYLFCLFYTGQILLHTLNVYISTRWKVYNQVWKHGVWTPFQNIIEYSQFQATSSSKQTSKSTTTESNEDSDSSAYEIFNAFSDYDLDEQLQYEKQHNNISASKLFLSKAPLYKSWDNRCLAPHSHKDPSHWGTYDMQEYKKAFDEKSMAKVSILKYDNNLNNFFNQTVFNEFIERPRQSWWKSYGLPYANHLPKDSTAIDSTRCHMLCLKLVSKLNSLAIPRCSYVTMHTNLS